MKYNKTKYLNHTGEKDMKCVYFIIVYGEVENLFQPGLSFAHNYPFK